MHHPETTEVKSGVSGTRFLSFTYWCGSRWAGSDACWTQHASCLHQCVSICPVYPPLTPTQGPCFSAVTQMWASPVSSTRYFYDLQNIFKDNQVFPGLLALLRWISCVLLRRQKLNRCAEPVFFFPRWREQMWTSSHTLSPLSLCLWVTWTTDTSAGRYRSELSVSYMSSSQPGTLWHASVSL